MSFSFVDPWHLYLPREGGHLVGISGSGGKTGFMQACAGQLAADHVPVIMSCTTRSEPLPGVEAYAIDSPFPEPLPGSLIYLHDGLDSEGKWRGLDPEVLDRWMDRFPDRVWLVETDGAAKKPLKFYREGEPVWPARTSLAVVVMGVGGVGLKAGDVVHRFAVEKLPGVEQLHAEKPWLWDHQLALLESRDGYLAQVPADIPAVLALGGLASQDDSIGLFEFVGRAMADKRLPLVTFFETEGDEIRFQTACTDRPDHEE